MDSLPIDVLGLIFDAADSETTTSSTADLSRVSRAWNEAWYLSKHWRRCIRVPRCHDETALVAAMRKTGWRAEDVELTGSADLFDIVLDNFANLRSLAFVVECGEEIRAPEKTAVLLRTLHILGGVPDLVVNRVVVPAAFPALEHLTLAGLEDYKYAADGLTRTRLPPVRASELPRSLRGLELSKCSRVFVMDASLPRLECLTATDLERDFVIGGRVRREDDDHFPGTYVYVPHDEYRCPALKTLRVKNSGVDVFATAGTTMRVESPSLSEAIFIKTLGNNNGYEKKTFGTEKAATMDISGGERHSLYVLNDDVHTLSFEEKKDRFDDGPQIVHVEPCLHRQSPGHLLYV